LAARGGAAAVRTVLCPPVQHPSASCDAGVCLFLHLAVGQSVYHSLVYSLLLAQEDDEKPILSPGSRPNFIPCVQTILTPPPPPHIVLALDVILSKLLKNENENAWLILFFK
jgi:hypothetical protein